MKISEKDENPDAFRHQSEAVTRVPDLFCLCLSSKRSYRAVNEHLALLSNLSSSLRRGLLLDVLDRELRRW